MISTEEAEWEIGASGSARLTIVLLLPSLCTMLDVTTRRKEAGGSGRARPIQWCTFECLLLADNNSNSNSISGHSNRSSSSSITKQLTTHYVKTGGGHLLYVSVCGPRKQASSVGQPQQAERWDGHLGCLVVTATAVCRLTFRGARPVVTGTTSDIDLFFSRKELWDEMKK